MALTILFQCLLVLATFLCSLVAGFLFAFAVVAMPGIAKLNDREFVRAFQSMDQVIQGNQPIFLVVWVGSVLTLFGSIALCFSQVTILDGMILVGIGIVYLVGVQLPTAIVNIPLNNRIQTQDTHASTDSEISKAREEFENRWNLWNSIRTIFACIAVAALITQLARS